MDKNHPPCGHHIWVRRHLSYSRLRICAYEGTQTITCSAAKTANLNPPVKPLNPIPIAFCSSHYPPCPPLTPVHHPTLPPSVSCTTPTLVLARVPSPVQAHVECAPIVPPPPPPNPLLFGALVVCSGLKPGGPNSRIPATSL